MDGPGEPIHSWHSRGDPRGRPAVERHTHLNRIPQQSHRRVHVYYARLFERVARNSALLLVLDIC